MVNDAGKAVDQVGKQAVRSSMKPASRSLARRKTVVDGVKSEAEKDRDLAHRQGGRQGRRGRRNLGATVVKEAGKVVNQEINNASKVVNEVGKLAGGVAKETGKVLDQAGKFVARPASRQARSQATSPRRPVRSSTGGKFVDQTGKQAGKIAGDVAKETGKVLDKAASLSTRPASRRARSPGCRQGTARFRSGWKLADQAASRSLARRRPSSTASSEGEDRELAHRQGSRQGRRGRR